MLNFIHCFRRHIKLYTSLWILGLLFYFKNIFSFVGNSQKPLELQDIRSLNVSIEPILRRNFVMQSHPHYAEVFHQILMNRQAFYHQLPHIKFVLEPIQFKNFPKVVCRLKDLKLRLRKHVFSTPENICRSINRDIWQMKTLVQYSSGGIWSPQKCRPQHRVAILVPYRDRFLNLVRFLRHMHPFLQDQDIDYGIFVVEQADNLPFNRGKLLNIGVIMALQMHDYNCFVLHDIDKLPVDSSIQYNCANSPVLLMNTKLVEGAKQRRILNAQIYKSYFGGVTAVSSYHFLRANGFVNHYWGWGAEDDDFYNRLKGKIMRPRRVRSHRYTFLMILHEHDAQYSNRFFPSVTMSLLQQQHSGIFNIQFELTQIQYKEDYTLISVRL